jgi:hypothetical protein
MGDAKKWVISLLNTAKLKISGQESSVIKACEACLQRKVRCDGVQPCQAYIKHSRPCFFRLSARRQLPSPDQTKQTTQSIVDPIPHDSDACTVQFTLMVLQWRVRQQNNLVRLGHSQNGHLF